MMWETVLDVAMALALVILTGYVVPWLNAQLKAKGREDLAKLISDLVAAAEQVFVGTGKGKDKKAYVVDALHFAGYGIDGETDAMIEAAVYRLGGEDK